MRKTYYDKLRAVLLSHRLIHVHFVIQVFTMFSWLLLLNYTSAYYVIYLMIGLCGFISRFVDNKNTKSVFSRTERSNLLVSSVFSMAIIAANHDIFDAIVNKILSALSIHSDFASSINSSQVATYSTILFFICFPVFFLGGMYNTFFILKSIEKRAISFSFAEYNYHSSPKKVWLTTFAALSVFYAAIMLLCFYPGIVTGDAVNQLYQIHNSKYSNWHPFYYTMIIRLFVVIGTMIFNDINIGVALYSLFSIMLLSSAFAYSVITLYQLKINKKIILAVISIYLLMPYHIIFSFTMWKDTPFSCCILLLTVSLFRYICDIGKKRILNAVISVFSGVGICVFRGNGLIVFFILLLMFALFFRNKYRILCISFASVLVVMLIMTYPILNLLDIEQSDTVELMSVPLQQISRTLVDCDDLTDRQKDLISKVADINEVRRNYRPHISDSIKKLIRNSGNQDYLDKHKSSYVLLYLEIGITHPKSYFLAWVDETRGYWNAGYDYWKYVFFCFENDLGIQRTVVIKPLQKACGGYCELFEYVSILQPAVSLGLHTWIILLIAFVGYRKKDKLTVLLTVPCLAVIVTLLLGTPVFAEFRYAYSLFCCLPFLAVVAFRRKTDILEPQKTGPKR